MRCASAPARPTPTRFRGLASQISALRALMIFCTNLALLCAASHAVGWSCLGRKHHSFQDDRSAAMELARGLIPRFPEAMPGWEAPSAAKPIVARFAVA